LPMYKPTIGEKKKTTPRTGGGVFLGLCPAEGGEKNTEDRTTILNDVKKWGKLIMDRWHMGGRKKNTGRKRESPKQTWSVSD